MSLLDLSTTQFLKKLSSNDPVPGGGSVAAIQLLQAANLIVMVCNLTLSSKKYELYHQEVNSIKENVEKMLDEIKPLADKDCEAFDIVAKAYGMPKDSEEEKQIRSKQIQEGLKKSAQVPLIVMNYSKQLVDYIELLFDKYNKNSASDLGVALLSVRSSLLGANMNVLINLKSIKDEEYVSNIKDQQLYIVNTYCEKIDSLIKSIDETFK